MTRSNHSPPNNHNNNSNHTTSSRSTPTFIASRMKYKGLFSPQVAPTTRAYCLLLSFLLGTLMLTAGSVFYHVILSRPMSGSHPIHTPPLPLALALISFGCLTILGCVTVAWRYGFDDGDDSLEEDMCVLAKDDVLDQQYQTYAAKDPPV